jgi:ketosteroid isomerase-like protein
MIAKYVITLVCLITLGCYSAFSQSNNQSSRRETVEKVINRLERERFNAYLKLDVPALERIMSNDYASVYADGQIVTKAEELAAMKSAPAGVLSSMSATIDQVSVHQVGQSAVLIGKLTLKGRVEWVQKPIVINAAFRYMAVYVKTGNRWQVVASQFTSIEEPTDK